MRYNIIFTSIFETNPQTPYKRADVWKMLQIIMSTAPNKIFFQNSNLQYSTHQGPQRKSKIHELRNMRLCLNEIKPNAELR